MFRWSFLLLCMLVVSLTTVATVHANEVPNPTLSANQTSIECSGQVHSEGDGDQSQGDSDKAVPHHHGCHGGASFLPARAAEATAFAIVTESLMTVEEAAPGRWSVGPDLRPPIA